MKEGKTISYLCKGKFVLTFKCNCIQLSETKWLLHVITHFIMNTELCIRFMFNTRIEKKRNSPYVIFYYNTI